MVATVNRGRMGQLHILLLSLIPQGNTDQGDGPKSFSKRWVLTRQLKDGSTGSRKQFQAPGKEKGRDL